MRSPHPKDRASGVDTFPSPSHLSGIFKLKGHRMLLDQGCIFGSSRPVSQKKNNLTILVATLKKKNGNR